jgi:hypothetical protein
MVAVITPGTCSGSAFIRNAVIRIAYGPASGVGRGYLDGTHILQKFKDDVFKVLLDIRELGIQMAINDDFWPDTCTPQEQVPLTSSARTFPPRF